VVTWLKAHPWLRAIVVLALALLIFLLLYGPFLTWGGQASEVLP
jgi:hypothetical protein